LPKPLYAQQVECLLLGSVTPRGLSNGLSNGNDIKVAAAAGAGPSEDDELAAAIGTTAGDSNNAANMKTDAQAMAEPLSVALAKIIESHFANRETEAARENSELRQRLADAHHQLASLQQQLGDVHTVLGIAQSQLGDAYAQLAKQAQGSSSAASLVSPIASCQGSATASAEPLLQHRRAPAAAAAACSSCSSGLAPPAPKQRLESLVEEWRGQSDDTFMPDVIRFFCAAVFMVIAVTCLYVVVRR
jgi:hypothetical protein